MRLGFGLVWFDMIRRDLSRRALSEWELSGENYAGRDFFGLEVPGWELPGRILSMWRSCQGGNFPGGVFRKGIYIEPECFRSNHYLSIFFVACKPLYCIS